MPHDVPELAGNAEAAEIIGISPTSVLRLSKSYPEEFPQPVSKLRCGPIWRADDSRKFAEWWPRRVGRPLKKKKAAP